MKKENTRYEFLMALRRKIENGNYRTAGEQHLADQLIQLLDVVRSMCEDTGA